MQSSVDQETNSKYLAWAGRVPEIASFCIILVIALIIYGILFNRETTLSHSIGYNLYGAERVLKGDIPYRDFHTLYPPGIVLINAALFKYFGITLYTALFGVYIFKALTAGVIYLCIRLYTSIKWALFGVFVSMIWLRPDGPFKAVPMHYGALFLGLALLFALIYVKREKWTYLALAGVSLGLVGLFKHNIGGYAACGFLIVLLMERRVHFRDYFCKKNINIILVLCAGIVAPVIPVLIYTAREGALRPMIRTLLFGPGEFLLGRLAATPSPFYSLILICAISICGFVVYKLRKRSVESKVIWLGMTFVLAVYLVLAKQGMIDSLVFCLPAGILLGGIILALIGKDTIKCNRKALALAVVAGAAGFLEVFPRFAREQSIGGIPLALVSMMILLYGSREWIFKKLGDRISTTIALTILPLAFLILGARFLVTTYFDSNFHLRSNVALSIERGRGVYFPKETATLINDAVPYIQARVPENGYFFAQSYTGSSLLFLTGRNNPSSAQFWAGVGVSSEEKSKTLRALDELGVDLVATSEKDLEAEKYEPIRTYLNNHFTETRRFKDVIILERKSR